MNRLSASAWLGFACAGAALVLATGCETRPKGPPPAEMRSARPEIALRGDTTFFDGQISAVVTIGHGHRFHGEESGPDAGGHGRHRGGPPGGGGGRDQPPDEDGDEGPRIRIQPLSRPPVTLAVTLTNRSEQSLDVGIRDVNSALGNFAVRPEHLLLAPGAESPLDPMVSRLVEVGDEIPVTITLRLAGQNETEVVTLHAVEAARDERP